MLIANDVRVNDPMPRHLRVRSAVPNQGNCEVAANRVSCEIGTMAVGQIVSITVRAKAVRAGNPVNTARVTSSSCETQPCDADQARIRIVKPRLALAKKVSTCAKPGCHSSGT